MTGYARALKGSFCLVNSLALLVMLQANSVVIAAGRPTDSSDAMRPGKQAQAAVLSFAKSMGCNEDFKIQNIVALPQSYGIGAGKFILVYFLDVGCSGGNTSGRSLIGILEEAPRGRFYVNPDYSRPAATIGLPPNILSLYIKNGQVYYKTKGYDFSKDAQCCPSVDRSGPIMLRNSSLNVNGESLPSPYWTTLDQ